MADVLADLKNWSVTASSNLPSGTTAIGTGLDDNLRQLQATVRQDLASVGANIASAGTCDLGAVAGLFHTITGTTTITSFGTVAAGIWKVLTFSGALTITHNGTSLICPYSANITTTANDTLLAESLGSGNWKIHPLHVATLYAALAGSSSQDFSAQNLTVNGRQNLKTGANIASAATIDLSTATGNLVHITGTTATSAVTMTAGQWMRCIADAAWPLTYHATNNRISGGADYTCASNDVIDYFYDGTTVYGHITKANGTPVVGGAFTSTNGIQAYNTSQTLTTAHKGKYVYIYGTGAVTLTLPAVNTFAAGESLLLANSQQSGAGTTTVSRAGTDVIFAKGSGALNTIELGFGDSVWLVSNGSSQWIAVAEASHIGIGQTWQSVTRTHGTTYYNNTGKPIVLSAASITGNGTHIITVGGVQVAQSVDAAGNGVPISAVIPPNGTSYVVSGTGTETWVELR